MARRLVTCRADDDIETALQLMRDNYVRRLPVVDGEGKLVGLLSLDDLACACQKSLRGGKRQFINEVAEVVGAISQVRAHESADSRMKRGRASAPGEGQPLAVRRPKTTRESGGERRVRKLRLSLASCLQQVGSATCRYAFERSVD